MELDTLTEFFKWCTVINAGLYIVWVLLVLWVPDFIYRVQTRWVPVSREAFNVAMYAFMGAFKIILIVFCIVPYVSLLIVG